MALSFAKDIRPLFRDNPDVETMKDFGLDLSSFAHVKAHTEEIYARVVVVFRALGGLAGHDLILAPGSPC